MHYEVENIIESIFESYLRFSLDHPNKKAYEWTKNKNPRKKFKTLKLFVEQDGKCYHCKSNMFYKVGCKHPLKTSLDRVIPGSQGGSYSITNLVLACNTCNKSRQDKSIEDFHQKLSSQP